jgi:hypothetical protein
LRRRLIMSMRSMTLDASAMLITSTSMVLPMQQ